MPAASASSTRHRRVASPRRASARAPRTQGRVRWDRLARAAMLCVLTALVYLYVSAGVHMISTLRQEHRDKAAVAALTQEHDRLLRQHSALAKSSTLEGEARQLGMMKKGEQAYIVSGLPNN